VVFRSKFKPIFQNREKKLNALINITHKSDIDSHSIFMLITIT